MKGAWKERTKMGIWEDEYATEPFRVCMDTNSAGRGKWRCRTKSNQWVKGSGREKFVVKGARETETGKVGWENEEMSVCSRTVEQDMYAKFPVFRIQNECERADICNGLWVVMYSEYGQEGARAPGVGWSD